MYNEFWTQAITTQLFNFVGDYSASQEASYIMGFSVVVSLSIMILSNMLIVIWFAIRLLGLYAFKYYLRVERVLDRIIYRGWEKIKSWL